MEKRFAWLEDKIKKLPTDPGVYVMRNKNDEIIYVGKAKNLKNRVRQYFQGGGTHPPKVKLMVSNIHDFEYIVVSNEVEALVLEQNLIKDNRPKYNILLRDDKQYPYIKITKERFPRVLKTREVKKDGGRYYGPYPNAYAVNDFIQLVNEVFRIRTCTRNLTEVPTPERPCLNYFIGRCIAPCTGDADEDDYLEIIGSIERMLKKKQGEKFLTDFLKKRMEEEAKALNFEKAAEFRDKMESLKLLYEEQKMVSNREVDQDIIALARGAEEVIIQVFFVRGGKILGREYFVIEDSVDESDPEILSSFIKQFYIGLVYIPSEIVTEHEMADGALMEEWLKEKKGSRVTILAPKKGERHALLTMVKDNANLMMAKHGDKFLKQAREQRAVMKELQELLQLDREIVRIESYDISNISGVDNVGAMVVFENAQAKKADYRKFKIKEVVGQDDYGSLREMLRRRFARAERGGSEKEDSFTALPDLILMDGGKGQVHVCKEVLDEAGFKIPVCGLVKDDTHVTRGIVYQGQEYRLEEDSSLYRFVYRVQEEVHRFAISFHRSLRSQRMLKSELDEIPQVGTKRRQALIKHFHNIENIKKASVEELSAAKGIDARTAKNIFDFFHGISQE